MSTLRKSTLEKEGITDKNRIFRYKPKNFITDSTFWMFLGIDVLFLFFLLLFTDGFNEFKFDGGTIVVLIIVFIMSLFCLSSIMDTVRASIFKWTIALGDKTLLLPAGSWSASHISVPYEDIVMWKEVYNGGKGKSVQHRLLYKEKVIFKMNSDYERSINLIEQLRSRVTCKELSY